MREWTTLKKYIWLLLLRGASAIIHTVTGTAPLVLENAIAAAIKSLKQYGKCEQPSGVWNTAITQYGLCEQNGTPTPSAPVDILCNNGVLRYSANMANVNEQTARVGYYINAQGAVLADQYNWFYQDFISVNPNTTYTLSMSSPVYYVTISEYSTAKDSGFIVRKTGTTGGNTSLTVTTGATTNYIRFGTNVNRVVVSMEVVLGINWMLNLGGTAMDYQTYVEGGIYTDGPPEVLTIAHNLYNPNGVDHNHYYDPNGVYTETQTVQLSNRVPVKSGDVIICTTTTAGTGGELNIRYNQLNTSGEWVSQEVQSQARNTTLAKTVTINQDGFFCFSGTFSGTTYVDFDATVITIESETQAVSVPTLLGVGDYKDETELIQGVKTGKVGIKVFDGTEDWIAYTSSTLVIQNATSDWGAVAGVGGYCTHLTVLRAGETTYAGACRFATAFNLYDYKTAFDVVDVAGFKAKIAALYAAGTPVILVYPLATETTEQGTDYPQLVNAKYNTASITAAISDIQVTFTTGEQTEPNPYSPLPIVCNNGELTWNGTAVVTDGTPEVLTVSADGAETQTVTDIPMLLGVGDYADEAEIISGLLTHKVGILVFDGSEAWRASSSANIYILESAIAVNLTAICTHFVKVANTTSASNMRDGSFKGHSSNTVLYFKDVSAGDVNGFKANLTAQYNAGTPVIVLYRLATEITESGTEQPLTTSEGTNTVSVTSNVDPVELEIEYSASA